MALCQNVTERNRVTNEHRLLFERNPQPLLAYDCQTLEIVAVSDASIESVGYTREEFLKMTILDIAPEEEHASMREYVRNNPARERLGLQRARPRRHRCKDGTVIEVEVTSDDLELSGRKCRVCLCQDVTERNLANAALAKARDEAIAASLRDNVTGVANRVALMERLTEVLPKTDRRRGGLALIFLDIDNFKEINDTLGHEAGDQVLTEVARRLTCVARRNDVVARIGGDEFVVLCENLNKNNSLQQISERVVQALRVPLTVNGQSLIITGSVGAVVAGAGNISATDLLRRADSAMYSAKHSGGNRMQIFDGKTNLAAESAAGLAGELRQAIDNKELYVVYQPLFSLVDGTVSGAETLVRWQHPQRGIVPPDQFIPLAEERGLIGEIDAFVLDEACRQLAVWRKEDGAWNDFTIGVNVSGCELNDPELVNRVVATLKKYSLPASQLCLEVTETALIAELGGAHHVIQALAALGVRTALDDFGTGYSALAHLQRLHVSSIKIDSSFVARIEKDVRDDKIVGAIIAMAHALGLYVVGEGIETKGQLKKLTELGCDKGQGYLLAKPLSPEDLVSCRESASSASKSRS